MKNILQSRKNIGFILLAILSTLSIFYFFSKSSSFVPVVKSSIPANNQFLNIQGVIQIEFKQELSASEQKNVSISSNSDFKYRIVWDAPNLMSIIPEDLQPIDNLILSILYKKKTIYDLNLIAVTSSYGSLELNQQAQQQAADDLIFSQKVKDFYDKYPFLNQLPISTPDYVMVFESDTLSIRARILGENESQIRQQVINKAIEIGVDTTKIPIRFIK